MNNTNELEGAEYCREVSCFFVPGQGTLSVTTNNYACSVEFDFFDIWEKLKKMEYDHVCMIHSHPPGCNVMSSTDSNMVYGWCQAIGKPILFIIAIPEGYTAYWCTRDKENKSKVNRCIVQLDCVDKFDELISTVYYLSMLNDHLSEEKTKQIVEIFNQVFNKANFIVRNEVEVEK